MVASNAGKNKGFTLNKPFFNKLYTRLGSLLMRASLLGKKHSLSLENMVKIDTVAFNFADACSLRCVYCPQSGNPSHATATPEIVSKVIDYVKRNHIKHVVFGFYGETHGFIGWEDYAEDLLDAGVDVNICSSFSHSLRESELNCLSRMRTIQFSIDTIDRDLLRQIRHPADVHIMLYNMNLIKAAALMKGGKPPEFTWNVTLTDKVVEKLPQLVASAHMYDVKSISVNDMADFADSQGGVKSVFELEGAQFLKAVESFETAKRIAADNGLTISFPPEKLLVKKKEAEMSFIKNGKEMSNPVVIKNLPQKYIQGMGRVHIARELMCGVRQGKTRDCLDPWLNIYISADGEVYSCCVNGVSLGNISGEMKLEEILQSEKYENFRMSLLNGDFEKQEICKYCHGPNEIDINKFRGEVSNLFLQMTPWRFLAITCKRFATAAISRLRQHQLR